MSILDPEEKIEDDLMITISKKMFKEAVKEATKECINKLIAEYSILASNFTTDINQMTSKFITIDQCEVLIHNIINHTRPELHVNDLELSKKIYLIYPDSYNG